MCELPLTGCMAISQIPEARTYRASAFLPANLGVERLLSLTINDSFGSNGDCRTLRERRSMSLQLTRNTVGKTLPKDVSIRRFSELTNASLSRLSRIA